MEIRVYALVVLGNPEVTFRGEREDATFCLSIYCVLVLYGVAVLELYVFKFLCLPYFWWYFIKTGSFPILNLCSYDVKFLGKQS